MMTNYEGPEKPIDPKLIEKINLLGATPNRDPEMAAVGRERFLTELDSLPAFSSQESRGWLAGLFSTSNRSVRSIRLFNRGFALSTIVAFVILLVALFGGVSATAFAAQSALPGDALYPVKTGLEETQISLSNDAYAQAKLRLQFAQRRLEEITGLLEQGRTNDVEFASNEFEFYIQQAMVATQEVMISDPELGAELSELVSQALLDYAVALKAVLLNAPDPVKPVVEKALLFSQEGAGEEIEIFGVVESISDVEIMIDGEFYLINDLTEFEGAIVIGDKVKAHVILTPDGNMIIREIEHADDLNDDDASGDDDNNNNNDTPPNDNGNSNDNDDGNVNDSDDDDSYDNSNDDDSVDNDNADNSNENDNEDDSEDNESENESGDDKVGTKSEDNANEDETNDNANKSEDNDNESEENENENSNDSDEEEEEEEEEEEDDNDNGG